MPRFKDQAICIRHIDWSETSQIVALLTEQHGVLRGLAKGSKRTSPSAVARYCGGIELLTQGQIVGMTKPTAELATITEWDLQEPYRHLRQNLRAQRLAMYGADLAAALLADHDPHPKAFAALARLLGDLSNPDRHDTALLDYQWRLLEDTGYRPQLNQDVRTGQPLEWPRIDERDQTPPSLPAYTFDPRAGGLTVAANGIENGSWRVRAATVALLQRQVAGRDGLAEGAPGGPGVPRDESEESLGRANRLLCAYARAILDRELPTMAYVFDHM